MEIFPKSANETVSGLRYFGRMLDKIRLHARGELPSDYHKNLGHPQAADGAVCNFLRVNYEDLRQRCLKACLMKKFWNVLPEGSTTERGRYFRLE